ncbi:hypothetical protein BC940DRAFT_305335 [Gongronella butleri]|nr:hypothetical protein BC940DRAFT_305335 [Gongronella butleri]
MSQQDYTAPVKDPSLAPKRKHADTLTEDHEPLDPSSKIGDEEDAEMKVKRKAQNRIAQRAFRERKERYVKELELRLQEKDKMHSMQMSRLLQEKDHLMACVHRLHSENQALKLPWVLQQPSIMPLASPPALEFQSHPFSTATSAPGAAAILPSPATRYSSLLSSLQAPMAPPQQEDMPASARKYTPIKAKHVAPAPPIIRQPKKRASPPIVVADVAPTAPIMASSQAAASQADAQTFTFSITTPESLQKAESNKQTPIQLVPLYLPQHIPPACHLASPSTITNSSSSSTSSLSTTSSRPSSTSPAAINIQHDDDDHDHAMDYPAFDQFILEATSTASNSTTADSPVSDQPLANSTSPDASPAAGVLNHTVVPLPLSSTILEHEASAHASSHASVIKSPKKKAIGTGKKSLDTSHAADVDMAALINAPLLATPTQQQQEHTPIWQKLTEHASNNKFSVDHFVEAIAKTTTSIRENRQLVDDWDLQNMVQDMDYYL